MRKRRRETDEERSQNLEREQKKEIQNMIIEEAEF